MGRFVSRDTWEGENQNPISLNRWNYSNANPIRYTDPIGHNPAVVLAAILPSLVGLVAGISTGAAVGAIFGACTYEWTISGECGCDIQQQAILMTRWEWIGMNSLSGGLIGGFSAALLGAGPAGLIVLGAVTIAISITDIIPAINELKTTGVNFCTATRVFLDVAGIVFGATGIVKGIRTWRTSGSPLLWSKDTQPAFAQRQEDIQIQKNDPVPPPANGGMGRVGEDSLQNYDAQMWVKRIRSLGATDIRINQHQVNVDNVCVGVNRPDLQYTWNN